MKIIVVSALDVTERWMMDKTYAILYYIPMQYLYNFIYKEHEVSFMPCHIFLDGAPSCEDRAELPLPATVVLY